MFVGRVPALAMGTNCYVLAPGEGEECLVVDPGIGVLDRLSEVLREHRLRPAAVLLTHGHLDHVFSLTPVCGTHDVPALLHGEDVHRLEDPLGSLGPELRDMLAAEFGPVAWSPPDDVRALVDGERVQVAGLDLGVRHAPGHTEGSVLFTLDGVPGATELAPGPPVGSGDALAGDREDLTSTVLSGDVLFAGSVGRTDLPGGDPEAMRRSLRDVVLPLPDEALVLPGHGPATTIARERRSNPFLLEVAR